MALSNVFRQVMLGLAVCCLALHVNAQAEEMQIITSGCFVAYVIIGAASLGDVFDGPLPSKVSLMFDAIGGALYLVSGLYCLKHYNSRILFTTRIDDIVLAKGTLAIINADLHLYGSYKN